MSRRGSRHGPVTGPLRPLVPPRDGGCGEGRISLPSLLETPVSPQLRAVGARPLGRFSTPSLLPTPPATSRAWQPGICRDWAGRGGEQRRGRERAPQTCSGEIQPLHPPTPAANDPASVSPAQASLPIPFRCHSPETLALTTRARGGGRIGRSRGADCLGRWEAVDSCWTSLEAA